ncbi:MAG: hypothetical protein NTX14_04480 [Candidatus Nealsonbacteria bacterium]|nr:hypothetical protein [Candidatus Nealsonbacteria bacterium]
MLANTPNCIVANRVAIIKTKIADARKLTEINIPRTFVVPEERWCIKKDLIKLYWRANWKIAGKTTNSDPAEHIRKSTRDIVPAALLLCLKT